MAREIKISGVLALACLVLLGVAARAADGAFPSLKTKTFSKDKVVFPELLSGDWLNVVFLAMSSERENGQYQQEALLAWHAALDERGVFGERVRAYHFPVMESPPFFVKGLITSAMRDSYRDKVPLDQAAVLYVDDLSAFAAAAGLDLDERPTIALADAAGHVLHSVKGEVSEDRMAALLAAIAAHRGTSTDP